MYPAVTEKHTWGFTGQYGKCSPSRPRSPGPGAQLGPPSPAHHTSCDPTCFLRKADPPLCSEERPRLFIKSWRKLPKSASILFLSPPKNGVSQTQTLQTTTTKIPPEPFSQTNIFNRAQLELDRSHCTRSHFPPSKFHVQLPTSPPGVDKGIITQLKSNYVGIHLCPPSSRAVGYNFQERRTVCFPRPKFVCFSVSFLLFLWIFL